jgi:subtilisin family serine protease
MRAQSMFRTSVMCMAVALAMAMVVPIASAHPPLQVPSPSSQAKAPLSDRYIVVLRDSVERPGRVAARHSENRDARISQVYRHALKGYAAMITPAELSAVRQDPNVAYVEPDARGGIATQAIPTGISRVFATLSEVADIDEEDDERVDVDVAVFDTGVVKHPDLNVVAQIDCTGNPCEEGGSDGHGHGTHVAGTLAAIDNEFGVVGVAPGARLWSIKVLDDEGFGDLSELIAGIDWVTATREDENPENDIEVTNASLRYWSEASGKAFGEALAASTAVGVVHVAAAGNESETVKYLPGANPEEITVSALDASGSGEGKDPLAWFSNFGGVVDVTAPGVDVYSILRAGYGFLSGTSMASPHVAGAAAILAALDKPESREDVEAIRDTIVEEGNLNWDDTSNDGIHEPLLSLSNGAVFGFVEPSAPSTVSEFSTDVTAHEANVKAFVIPNGIETTYQFEYGKTSSYGSLAPASPEVAGRATVPIGVGETLEGLDPDTTYFFRVTVTNALGTAYGKGETFKTAPLPIVVTDPASGVGATKATLRGRINPKGLATSYQFEYGLTASYGYKVPSSATSIGSGSSVVEVSDPISFYPLPAGTTVHYRVVANSPMGSVSGPDETFTTTPPRPEFSLAFESWDTGENELNMPIDVASNSEGDIWAVTGLNRLQKYTPEGELLDQVGSGGSGAGEFYFPTSMAIDSEDNLWIVDSGNHRVQKFNSEGEYLDQFGSLGSSPGQMNYPMDIAIDGNGNLWVSDFFNNRIQKFAPNGEYISSLGSEGSGNGQFSMPYGVAIDAKGNLWAVDSGNYRVQKFNSEGEYLSQFGSEGSEPGEFGWPIGIAIDAKGFIWVTDNYNSYIHRFDPKGEYRDRFGSEPEKEGGGFLGPTGIDVDAEGTVWVADGYRVQKGE